MLSSLMTLAWATSRFRSDELTVTREWLLPGSQFNVMNFRFWPPVAGGDATPGIGPEGVFRERRLSGTRVNLALSGRIHLDASTRQFINELGRARYENVDTNRATLSGANNPLLHRSGE
jgi:hypothetical protein